MSEIPQQPSTSSDTPAAVPAPAPAAAATQTAAPTNPAAQQRQRASQMLQALRLELQKAVVGQRQVVDDVLTALIAGGHVLVEGVPGLGKTLLVRALAKCFGGEFARIQFTPDLMPSDVTGHAVYDLASEQFKLRKGPAFTNLLLADEINRAPAKTQAALLEVMQERQITLEGRAMPVPQPFLVMATQNPIEQEGTFPLPEAQLDRFLMHVRIGYPQVDAETEILRLARDAAREAQHPPQPPARKMPLEDIFAARKEVLDLHFAPALERYLIELVLASRDASRYDPALARRIAWGASPRGSIALERCARAHAWLAGRDYVTPDDVRAMAPDVLRHRVLSTYEASAEGWDGGRLVDALLAAVPLP